MSIPIAHMILFIHFMTAQHRRSREARQRHTDAVAGSATSHSGHAPDEFHDKVQNYHSDDEENG